MQAEERQLLNVRDDIGRQRREKEALEAEVLRLDLSVTTALHEIRKLRVDEGKAYFEKQGRYIEGEIGRTKQEILDDLEDRQEISEKIYEIQKTHWETNKDEFERRAKLFEGELSRVENRLGQARKRVAQLHDLGITRTTASFLIWVGYISLAGIGGVIGSFFQKRQAGEADFLSQVFRGFLNLVSLTQPSQADLGAWWIIVAPMPLIGFVILYLLVVWGAVSFMDWRLRKFDPTWGGDAERDKRKGRGQRGRSGLLDRFSSYMPTPDVDRKSYRQLLAYFPFVILSALIVWLFSAGIPPAAAPGANGATAPDPTFGLATAYLGVIFTLLSTSAALLYATKIIEPRWKKFEGSAGSKGIFDKYVRVNWEVALLMALLVVCLLLAAILPLAPSSSAPAAVAAARQYNLLSWGAVAIFMCLCSLGLAYGLIQRGLFRDEEFFERKRQVYRHQIEKHRIGPTLGEVFERANEPFDDAKSLITNYREAKHMLDEYRMLYELKEIFDDDFDEDATLPKVLGKIWPKSDLTLRKVRLRGYPAGEPRPIDYVIAPQETAQVLTSRAARKASQNSIEGLNNALTNLEREQAEAKTRIANLAQKVRARRQDKLNAIQEYHLKKSALCERQAKETLLFEAAYAVGRLAYVQLKDELGTPPRPPAPAPATAPPPPDIPM
jgi:hypothetical protein